MSFEITNKPTPDKLKDIFVASESYASDHLHDVRGWEDDILADNRSRETNATNESQTRSSVTIKHIRKLLEWRYPVIEQAFLARRDLFNPAGRESRDEAVADAHKKILNYQMNNEIDKVTLVARMVRAFLNQGTVIMRLGWKSEKGIPTRIVPVYEYGYVSAESDSYARLEQAYAEVLSTLEQAPQAVSSLPVHLVEGAKYYEKFGKVVDVKVTGFTEKKGEDEVYIYNQPVLDVVNVYDVFAAPECKTNIQDSPYVIFRFTDSIHEIEMNEDYDTKDVHWDSVVAANSGTDSSLRSIYSDDDKRRHVNVYEYWGLHDIDGKGDLQPVKITWVEGFVIECVANPFPDKKHPFYSAAYSPDVTLESFYGSSDAELAKDNQAILSAMHRGIIDIHANSAYGQKGIAKNVLDPINRAKFQNGENFEYDPNLVDPAALFHTFDFPQVNPSTMAYMQQINADSDALTGIKSFNEGISGNALGNTAAGVTGVLSATALRESSIIGRLEAMLIAIAKRIMQLNILYLDTDKIIQLAGVEGLVIKTVLNPLIDVKLDVTNQAEDALKAQEMSFMLQTLGQTLPPELVKSALMQIAELRNMNKFYNLLENFDMSPPEPSPQEQEINALQIELLKAQLKNELAKAPETQSKTALNQAKAATEQANTGKVAAEAEQTQVETERLVTGQETEDKIRIISAQGESNAAAAMLKQNGLRGMNTP